MLDPREIDIEIARLEYGESSYPAYAKLATLYTIKNQITKSEQNQQDPEKEHSLSAAPEPEFVGLYGDSEFLREIEGRNKEDVLSIVDDLMDTLQVTNPRVYNGVMRKLRSI